MKMKNKSGGNMIRNFIYLSLMVLVISTSCTKYSVISVSKGNQTEEQTFPLITIGENFNVSSISQKLYDSHLQYLDGQIFPFTGTIRVDGKSYRFMGGSEQPDTIVAGMSYDEEWMGKYTFIQPEGDWFSVNYDDKEWNSGGAPFGTLKYHSQFYPQINTIWQTPSIWVRRKVKINGNDLNGKKLYLKYSHDDECELYINGIAIVKTGYNWGENKWIEIPEKVRATLQPGEIIIAAHGKNLLGDGLLDFGIYIPDKTRETWQGKYTVKPPAEGWEQGGFDDTTWDTGNSPFGTPIDYEVNTVWNTPEIWVRKAIIITPEDQKNTLVLDYSHDDLFELYANGILLVKTGFEWGKNRRIIIPDSIKKNLKDNKLCIAVHCCNKAGGGLVDFHVLSDDIANQQSVNVQATQTSYQFKCGPVELLVTFMVPLLLDDMEVLSRPINYISSDIVSLDGKKHKIDICFEMLPTATGKRVSCDTIYKKNNLLVFKMDKLDGRYFYICTDTTNVSVNSMNNCICINESFGEVFKISAKLIIGFENSNGVQYFGETVSPYWNRTGNKTIEQLFTEAYKQYREIKSKCNAFDQTFHKLGDISDYRKKMSYYSFFVDNRGCLLLFPMNGISDMMTTASLFLFQNKELFKAQLTPLLLYAESNKWEKEYAPSNIGKFPLFNGETKEISPPIETTSDILFLLAMYTPPRKSSNYIE